MSPAVTRIDVTCVVPAIRLSNAVAEALVWATPTFELTAEEGSEKLDVKDANASDDVARTDVEAGVSTPCSKRDWVVVGASEVEGVCQWIDAAPVVEGHGSVVFLACVTVCKPCPVTSETAGDAATPLLLSEDVMGDIEVGVSLLLDVK